MSISVKGLNSTVHLEKISCKMHVHLHLCVALCIGRKSANEVVVWRVWRKQLAHETQQMNRFPMIEPESSILNFT